MQEENVAQPNKFDVSAEESSQVVMMQKEDEKGRKELGGMMKKELVASSDVSPVASISAIMTTPMHAATAMDVVVDFDVEAENIVAHKVPQMELFVSCKSIATCRLHANSRMIQLSNCPAYCPRYPRTCMTN
eukprot:scaffold128725_cov62-Attheya_sp.AAC.4